MTTSPSSDDPNIPRLSERQLATPPSRRRFTREFKDDTARLVLEHGYSASAAARAVGVSESSVGQWVREARAAQGLTESPTPASQPVDADAAAEIKALRRQLAEARMENEILACSR